MVDFNKFKDYTNAILSEKNLTRKGRWYYYRARGTIEDVKTSKAKKKELASLAFYAAAFHCRTGTLLEARPIEANDQCYRGALKAHNEHLEEIKK